MRKATTDHFTRKVWVILCLLLGLTSTGAYARTRTTSSGNAPASADASSDANGNSPASIPTSGNTRPPMDPNQQQQPSPQDQPTNQTPADSHSSSPPKSDQEDYSGTPFTQYGEFHEANEEEDTIRFLQSGRLFGVSLGTGFQFVDGYRGSLWQGGFPVVEFKVHYWFDFNIAIDLGFYTAYQYFNTTANNAGHVDVNLVHVGLNAKYYFPVQNLSAAISFANPYILAGFGSYTKTQISNQQNSTDSDTELGVTAGVGFEFVINPKKTYFVLEGKVNIVTFKDTYTTLYQSVGLPNMTGNFYLVTGGLLFTW